MLADPIAPKSARSRQIKNGTICSAADLPNAAEISRSRRQIFETGRTLLTFCYKYLSKIKLNDVFFILNEMFIIFNYCLNPKNCFFNFKALNGRKRTL